MPPVPCEPSDAAKELLLAHLSEIRSDFIRQLMRDNSITGVSDTKEHLIDRVRDALRTRNLSWDVLIAFLDRHEPNGKQRVLMFKASTTNAQQFSATAIQTGLQTDGENDVWNASVPVAAPEELTLSSVTAADGRGVVIVAIGRRRYRERVKEREGEITLPEANMEVRLYRWVDVRAWVRAELNPATGDLNIRAVSLPQESAQSELFNDFIDLIGAWFPMGLFAQLNLHKAIKALHDGECAGPPCDAMVQAVGYDDASGRSASLRSASGTQSINGAAPNYQAAIDTFRSTGTGRDGNFYFLPTAMGGKPNTPIGDKPVRVLIKANDGRVDFSKPHTSTEIAYVLGRVRVLAR